MDLSTPTSSAAPSRSCRVEHPGQFGRPIRLTVGRAPQALATGDFDRDGRIDIAVADRIGRASPILFNRSTKAAAGEIPRRPRHLVDTASAARQTRRMSLDAAREVAVEVAAPQAALLHRDPRFRALTPTGPRAVAKTAHPRNATPPASAGWSSSISTRQVKTIRYVLEYQAREALAAHWQSIEGGTSESHRRRATASRSWGRAQDRGGVPAGDQSWASGCPGRSAGLAEPHGLAQSVNEFEDCVEKLQAPPRRAARRGKSS